MREDDDVKYMKETKAVKLEILKEQLISLRLDNRIKAQQLYNLEQKTGGIIHPSSLLEVEQAPNE